MTAATAPALACGLATAIAGGENASPAAAGPHAPSAAHPNPTKETPMPLTDTVLEPLGHELAPSDGKHNANH